MALKKSGGPAKNWSPLKLNKSSGFDTANVAIEDQG